ncbi:MAG: hypothetical protein ACKVS9_13405 [Phycisphaerae bacterium]
MQPEPIPQPVCRVEAVREVRIEIAPERVHEMLRFYETVLGLTRWPERLEPPGCVGIGSTRGGIVFVMRHDPEVDPNRRRLTATVASLEQMGKYLEQQAIAYERSRGFWYADNSIAVFDPLGYRIEIRESHVL